jgi:hypothetical protein
MIEQLPLITTTLGLPTAVAIYALWDRHQTVSRTEQERQETLRYLEKAIKVHLVGAINELKVEIVKLNERCNGGKK